MNDNIQNIVDHLEDSIVSRLDDIQSHCDEIYHLLDIEYEDRCDLVLTPCFSIDNTGTVLEYPDGPLPAAKNRDRGTARKKDKKCKKQRTDSYYPPGTRVHSDTSAFVASVFNRLSVPWNHLINQADEGSEPVPIRPLKVMDHIRIFHKDGGMVDFTANSSVFISRLRTEEENCAVIKAHIVNLLTELQKSVTVLGPP